MLTLTTRTHVGPNDCPTAVLVNSPSTAFSNGTRPSTARWVKDFNSHFLGYSLRGKNQSNYHSYIRKFSIWCICSYQPSIQITICPIHLWDELLCSLQSSPPVFQDVIWGAHLLHGRKWWKRVLCLILFRINGCFCPVWYENLVPGVLTRTGSGIIFNPSKSWRRGYLQDSIQICHSSVKTHTAVIAIIVMMTNEMDNPDEVQ